MAKSRTTLKQRIGFQGGEEMEAQLTKIGKTGEAMIAQLGKAFKGFQGPAKRLSDAVKRVKAAMQRLRAAGKRLGDSWRRLGRSARRLRSSLGRTTRNLALITAGALAAAGALFKLAQSGAAAADAAGKTAQGVGLEIDELGRLVFAAKQSGISQEKFLNILTRFAQGLGELADEERKAGSATKKTGDLADRAREAYEKFGVTVRDMSKELAGTAKGLKDVDATGSLAARALKSAGITALDAQGNLKPFVDQIFEFANATKALPDGLEKVKSLIDVTGTRNARLAIVFFNQGAAGLRALGDEAERFGFVFTPAQFKRSEEAIDALSTAATSLVGSGVLKGLQQEIGLLFAEDLKRGADAFTAALARNKAAIVAFAEGKIRQVIALVEDLVAAIQGRDADVKEPFILEARDAIVAFAHDVKAAFDNIILPAFRALLKAADFVAEAINAVLGTDLSGRQILIAAAVAQLLGLFVALGAAVAVVFSLLAVLANPLALVLVAFAAAGIAIAVFWDDIKAGAQGAADFIIGLSEDAANFIIGLSEDLGDVIGGFADAMAERLVSAFRGAVDIIGGILKRLADLAARAIKAAREALGLSGGGSAGGAPVPDLAGGGQVRGAGTPTSDSILARLSDTEFVIQAKAVRHYGASLFAALNSLRLPKGALGFSVGGLVDGINRSLMTLGPIPAYAGGGAVAAGARAPAAKSGTPVTIVLDGQRFPAMADQDVAEALGRVALRQARTRIGRPPSRI